VRRPPREHIKRLGKGAGAVVDALEALGGSSTAEKLAAVLGVKRARDLSRRVIARLEEAGVVECSQGGVVSFSPEWLEALNRDRERGGEIADYRRDLRRYSQESEAWRNRQKIKPGRAPTEREMRERREGAQDGRQEAIRAAIARLFSDRPEYRGRRVGQITCAITMHYLGPDFLRGTLGAPKDAEVESILDGAAA